MSLTYKGANAYPIGYYNKSWVEILLIASKALGYTDKKVTTIPDFLYKIGGTSLSKCHHVIDRFSEDIDIAFSVELGRGARAFCNECSET